MKILFEVIVADGFYYPPDDGLTNLHLWPIASRKHESMDIEIEFEPSGEDIMKDAEKALDDYVKKTYPNKKYKIYYWWWK